MKNIYKWKVTLENEIHLIKKCQIRVRVSEKAWKEPIAVALQSWKVNVINKCINSNAQNVLLAFNFVRTQSI